MQIATHNDTPAFRVTARNSDGDVLYSDPIDCTLTQAKQNAIDGLLIADQGFDTCATVELTNASGEVVFSVRSTVGAFARTARQQ